ncbi:SDR family oxidoreductase [Chryseobacterium aahli]|uniref:SDR family NAD(P)-dependent oxidoreductase n=1 Tax=Chryseobacterium aahli TaxID=1278643 RepID=UPI001F60FEAC|nr:SDR family NAD(P)-dependent oxidoreductase [Chryseobacterium aahli]MCI3936302.1 SDR family oxidoreductase [Chryseobacterium aahli]
MKKLNNKVAIITGGSGSIGKATAELFLQEGAKVLLVDLSEESLKSTVEELNNEHVKYCVADVSKVDDVKKYTKEAVKVFGKIDVFFNNAGIEGVVKPIIDYPDDIFDQVISVNVKGVWLGNKYVLPQMNDGGSIIMTSSVAGIVGFVGLGAYVTSKHAVVGIMKTTALEAASRKIRVNSVHPSPVNNRMMRSIEEGSSSGHGDEVKKQFEAAIPLGRYAESSEIANLVLFLASDDSKFITGTTQIIDGGMCAQ